MRNWNARTASPQRISLNSVRVFVVVARCKSISLAAKELHVTASAISHQVKKLETELGVALFIRTNNTIELAEAGHRLYADASMAVNLIDRAALSLNRSQKEITVRSSMSFGVRWLIPALEQFSEQYPDIKLRVETLIEGDISLDQSADIAIAYRLPGDYRPGEETIWIDMARPVVSPKLLQKCGYRTLQDIGKIPALQCAAGNWDWTLWASNNDLNIDALRFHHTFDTDDAALRAAAAGMGMVLTSDAVSILERESGLVTYVPYTQPVELGRYSLILTSHLTPSIRVFRDWMLNVLKSIETKPDSWPS